MFNPALVTYVIIVVGLTFIGIAFFLIIWLSSRNVRKYRQQLAQRAMEVAALNRLFQQRAVLSTEWGAKTPVPGGQGSFPVQSQVPLNPSTLVLGS